MHAVVGGDFGLPLDKWASGHEDEFVGLITDACQLLAARDVITAEQAAEWQILDGATVLWRGADELSVRPVLILGEALIRIVRGTYPTAPWGQWWYFGSHRNDGRPTTIAMRAP